MAECNEDEESKRAIFRDKTKNKIGYGSCASAASVSATGHPSPDKAEYYIEHEVKDGESLASIALRYGLKSSHIQRINHLWNDRIVWHSVLFIPILSLDLIPKDYEGEILSKTMLSISRLHHNQYEGRNGKEEETPAPDLDSAAEYFAKFDISLARIKDSLEKIEKESNVLHRNSNSSLRLLSNKETNPSHRSCSSEIESLDPSREPELRFTGISQSRSSKVRASTLEQLEAARDKLFQL